MNNVLLDNNILIDFLSEERLAKHPASRQLYEFFLNQHANINYYISSSSIDNLEFILFHELKKHLANSNKQILHIIHLAIKDLLQQGIKIAKTPSYIDINYEDIEGSQVIASAIGINSLVITRDEGMLKKYPDIAIKAETFLAQLQELIPSIDFANLRKQYFQLQPKIEKQMDEVLNATSFIMGNKVRELEVELEHFTGANHGITCSSGTDALLLAMMAMDIQPGDEIITTPFTFIATAETVALMKAVPVFVDIDPSTLNIDASLIESAITDRTKAIIPVSLYGQPPDLDEINQIARKHDLKVILDGAQSFGATYKGKMEVHHCDIYVTSFFPAKPLGCYGDGGAVLTNDDGYAEKIRMLRVHGQNRRYHHQYIGMGGRLDTLQAAVLLAKFPQYPMEISLRQKIADKYTQSLASFGSSASVAPVVQQTDRTSVWAQYTVLTEHRDQLQVRLREHNIPTAVHYPKPLFMQDCFKYLGCAVKDFPVSVSAANRVLSLPMNPLVETSDLTFIVDVLCG